MHDVTEVKRGEEAERLGFFGLYFDKQLTKKKGKRVKYKHEKRFLMISSVYNILEFIRCNLPFLIKLQINKFTFIYLKIDTYPYTMCRIIILNKKKLQVVNL